MKEEAVSLQSDRDCGAVVSKAAEMAAEAPRSALIFLRKEIYEKGGRERIALRCRVSGELPCLYSDGSKPEGRRLRRAFEIMAPSSPLPTFPRVTPEIFVELRPEVFRLTRGRKLQQVAQESLLDPRFVFLLRGVRCGTKFFWDSYFNSFFIDAESGEMFDRGNLPEEQRFVLLLMEDGSYPPRCKKSLWLSSSCFLQKFCAASDERTRASCGTCF